MCAVDVKTGSSDSKFLRLRIASKIIGKQPAGCSLRAIRGLINLRTSLFSSLVSYKIIDQRMLAIQFETCPKYHFDNLTHLNIHTCISVIVDISHKEIGQNFYKHRIHIFFYGKLLSK